MPTVPSFVKLRRINSGSREHIFHAEEPRCGVAGWPSMKTPTALEADPAHWRQRAENARRDADLATDPIDRDTLIGIANAYKKLAVIAEAKLASKP